MRTFVLSLILLASPLIACGPDVRDGETPIIDTDGTNNGIPDDATTNNDPADGDPNNDALTNNASTNNGVSNNEPTNNASNNGMTNNGETNNNDVHVGTAEEVDPNCIDGQYAEALPDYSVDISAEVAAYSSSNVHQFYDDILEKRYPVGAHLVRGGLSLFDCVQLFSQSPSSAGRAIGSLSVVVHECAHAFDLSQGTNTYVITPDQTLSCSGAATFARSLIGEDEYQEKRPPCGAGFLGCDHYYDTYLSGRGSDQGFDMVLEETTQYVDPLATSYAFHDFSSSSISAKDGILTFLWYVERYLRMARLQYPDDYALLTEPCWREAILTVWGRAWWILEASDGLDDLGIDEEALFELVRDPELLGEIQRLRDLEGC